MEEIRMRMLNRVNAGEGDFAGAYCNTCRIYLWVWEDYNEHKTKGHNVLMNVTLNCPD